MRKFRTIGIVVCLLMSTLFVAGVAIGAHAITLSPDSGVVYTKVRVDGSGFSSNVNVVIYWDNFGTLLNSTTTSPTGTFQCYIDIPEATGGYHTVIARDATGNQATARFLVVPHLQILDVNANAEVTSAHVGDQIRPDGTGFGSSVWVSLYWDGNYWTRVRTNTAGSFLMNSVNVPEMPYGWHTLTATDTSGNTASTMLFILPAIVINPDTAHYGDSIRYTCTGFSADALLRVYIDSTATLVAETYTSSAGSATGTFILPSLPFGTHNVFAVDENGASASTTITVTPYITLSEYTGFVGNGVGVTAYGYHANASVSVYWDANQLPTTPSSVLTNSNGEFYCQITVPYTPYGTHIMRCIDNASALYDVAYNVMPSIHINPDHGLVSTPFTTSCTGFSAHQSIDIYWDFGLPTQVLLVSGTTDSTGSYNTTASVPQTSNGSHAVTAIDGDTHNARTFFYVGPVLFISPSSGYVGSAVQLTGYTFSPNVNVRIYWDGSFVGNIGTDGNGDFIYSFTVPHACYGTHTVRAVDDNGVTAETSFFVLPSITVSPAHGYVGNYTTVTGTGFYANSIVYIYWDGTNTYRSEWTNGLGDVLLTIQIPEATAGMHEVRAHDVQGVDAIADYTVIPSIAVDRDAGYVGENFTVYVHGFGNTVIATLVWDGISTSYATRTSSVGYGEISARVPAATAGRHEIFVYDAEFHTSQTLGFTVLALDAPTPIAPTGYINTTTPVLTWSSVPDASRYIVQYDTNPAFTNPVEVVSYTNFTTLAGLSHGTKYYWHVKTVDTANNTGNFSAALNFTVDINPPISALSAPAYASSREITITYSASDDVSGVACVALYYAYNNTNYTLYATSELTSGAFVFNALYGDGVYHFYTRATDKSGNMEIPGTVATVIVDTQKPVAYVEPLPPTENTLSFNLSIVAGDGGSGVRYVSIYYSCDGGSTWEFYGNYTTQTVTFITGHEGRYWFQAVAVDLAGNVEMLGDAEATTCVDVSAPSVWVEINGTLGNNGWYLSAVTVTMQAADNGSGVSAIYYAVDGGAWQTYGGAFVLSASGRHTIAYYAADAAGNHGTVQQVALSIDQEIPDGEMVVSDGWYTHVPVSLKINASDDVSGVGAVYYSINGAPWCRGDTVVLNAGGVYNITYFAVDVAGNAGMVRYAIVRVDTKAPVSMYKLTGNLKENGWYTGTVLLELSAEDDVSGVGAIYWALDSTNYTLYAGPINISGDGVHVVHFYALDAAGNAEESREISVSIDSTPPFTQAYVNDSWYSSVPLTIYLNATDSVSGVVATYYRINGEAWRTGDSITFVADGVYVIDYYSVDMAGNAGTIQHASVKIDTTVPDVEYISMFENGTTLHGSTDVVLSMSDLSGIANFTVKIDSSMVWYYTENGRYHAHINTTKYTDGEHTLVIQATDMAGNVLTITRNFSIDNTAPHLVSSTLEDGMVVWGSVSVRIEYAENGTITEATVVIDGKNEIKPEISGNTVSFVWDTIHADNGKHRITIVVKDAAGNTDVQDFTVSVNNPDYTVYVILVAVIAGIIIAFVGVWEYRKRRVTAFSAEVKE